MMGFLVRGDLNISEFPTKELIQRLQRRKKGTTILGSPLCFLSQGFAKRLVFNSAVTVSISAHIGNSCVGSPSLQTAWFNLHLTILGIIVGRCVSSYFVGRLVWSDKVTAQVIASGTMREASVPVMPLKLWRSEEHLALAEHSQRSSHSSPKYIFDLGYRLHSKLNWN